MAVTAETLKVLEQMRKQLASMTATQTVALTRAWVEAWDVLQPEFNAAILELLAAAKNGRVPASVVARNIRLRDTIQQARAMLDELAGATNVQVTTDVGQAMLDALDHHEALVRSQLPPGQAGAGINFNRVSPEAVASMVERTAQSIHKFTRPLPADVERMMKQQLIRGITVGDNPRRTAARILKLSEGEFNGGLTRALNIARTETLDAHRAATQSSEATNTAILEEWEWHASLSGRTCPSCLSKHGTRHPLDEPGPNDHPSGRCARVTITKSWADLGFKNIPEPASLTQSSEDWYKNLTPESQVAIMGKARAELLANGDISWADLSRRQENPGWRPSYNATPVKDLRPVG